MKTLLLSFSLLITMAFRSQTGWDLQQCIAYAEKHNISLKQAALNSEINKTVQA